MLEGVSHSWREEAGHFDVAGVWIPLLCANHLGVCFVLLQRWGVL